MAEGGGGHISRMLDIVPSLSARRVVTVASYVVSAVVITSWLVLAVVHADDRYAVGWSEGTRMALAREARDGILFPPLFDSGVFGGTRYMPLPVVLHAALSLATNDYLVSGKLVAYAGMVLMLTIMFVLMRTLGCPRDAALVIVAAVLVTRVGLQAATGIQGDTLAVAFQLAAVAVVMTRQGRIAAVFAAVLCALAVTSKLSAVWAPVAICAWLVRRDRGRLWVFLAAFALALSVSAAILVIATEGRIVEDLRLLAFAGVGGAGAFLRAPLRLLDLLWDGAPAIVVLMPFALLVVARPSSSRLSLIALCWFVCGCVLVVVMADEGALTNHLLDFIVLTLVLVGGSLGRQPAVRDAGVPAVLYLALLWAVAASFLVQVRPDLTEALHRAGRDRYATAVVTEPVRASASILSEDPTVPVLLDQRPVVLDAWMVLRINRDHPSWSASLVDRIAAKDFDSIVLAYPATFDGWYRTVQLGEPAISAIRSNYRLAEEAGGLYFYVPAP